MTRCNAQAGTPRVIRCAREFGFRRPVAAHGVWGHPRSATRRRLETKVERKQRKASQQPRQLAAAETRAQRTRMHESGIWNVERNEKRQKNAGKVVSCGGLPLTSGSRALSGSGSGLSISYLRRASLRVRTEPPLSLSSLYHLQLGSTLSSRDFHPARAEMQRFTILL